MVSDTLKGALGHAALILRPAGRLILKAVARLKHLDRGHGMHFGAHGERVSLAYSFAVSLTIRGAVCQVQLRGQLPGRQIVNKSRSTIGHGPRHQGVNVEIRNNKTAHFSILSGCPVQDPAPVPLL
jgi:hypothetical protein